MKFFLFFLPFLPKDWKMKNLFSDDFHYCNFLFSFENFILLLFSAREIGTEVKFCHEFIFRFVAVIYVI